MINGVIGHGVLLALSVFEVWLYYQMLFNILIDKQYMKNSDKAIMWGSIVVVGVTLTINRNYLYFSSTVFIFTLLLMTIFTELIQKNQMLLVMGIVFAYNSLIALFDFGFAFLGLAILGKGFSSLVYFRGLHAEKLLVYICSRIIMMLIVLWIPKIKNEIIEFRNTLLALGIVCIIQVRRYQMLLAKMVFGDIAVDWKNSMISLLFTLAIMAFICIILFKYKMIQQENNFILMKETMEQQKYEEVNAAIEKNRELIHDTKNHYIIISEYESKGEYEKLHKYVEELKSEFVKINPQIYTGNSVIDLVLNQKRIMAERKKISFELQAVPLPKLPFKDSEICTILGNLLDNAIEACERMDGESRICVKIEKQMQLLFIEVINTISETPLANKKVFSSSKKDKAMHGYGLKSVQRIVDLYEGDVIYKIKEDKFIVRLTFFDIDREQEKKT